MFEPFMKSFYVRSTDATHIKTLKVKQTCLHFMIVLCYIAVSCRCFVGCLMFISSFQILQLEILTSMANEANISTILREFQVKFHRLN